MNNAIAYELKKLEAKFPGYDFTATLKPNVSLLEPKQVIKNIVTKLKTEYDDINFSLARKTYNAFAIINFKSKPGTDDLAWYGGDDCGYECDGYVRNILKTIQSDEDFKNLGLRANFFLDGTRSGCVEIYN